MAKLRERMRSGEMLAGTFVKSPSYEVIEVLAKSGMDFACLDAEHAPFDRGRMDACLAVANALDFPLLVRVGAGTPQDILQALDAGAVGIVVPHVDSVEKAEEVARAARFGLGGRGYAGTTRWAGYGTGKMPELLQKSKDETIVLVQIEEPEAVDAAAGIAAVEGVDGLFIGPADLSVGYGRTSFGGPELEAAMASVGKVAKDAGKAFVTWAPNGETAAEWRKFGFNVFLVGSEHSYIHAGAAAVTKEIKAL